MRSKRRNKISRQAKEVSDMFGIIPKIAETIVIIFMF